MSTNVKKLSEFGINLDINTDNAEKWVPDEEHTVTGVHILNGEHGEYPAFIGEDGKLLIAGGTVVTRTAHQLAEIFQNFPKTAFKLVLKQKESGTGRIYNVLVEVKD